MDSSEYIVSTPWDSKVFGLDTFEIIQPSEEVLELILHGNKPGHYTVRLEPLSSKKLLHNYGFYYCDTLIEPYGTVNNFVEFKKPGITISRSVNIDELIKICHGAFIHGRFHRDFNLGKKLADLRYDSWLKELYASERVFGLMDDNKVAGFWGFDKNKILLHALSEEYKGKGMAKYFWSVACRELFNSGNQELISSISVANLAVLNLYSSLGFRFRNPKDVYHILLE